MSDDLISRKQALHAVEWDTEAYTAINMLPSVDEVKHGRWIPIDWAEPRRYGCSECHRMVWQLENYCPSCGARMDGDTYETD